MNLSDDDLKTFARAVQARLSLDFPEICDELGFSWFQDVRPKLGNTPWFMALMEESLERLKYKLYSKILDCGMNGKKGGGKDPELSYLRAVINYIDSGSLLSPPAMSEGGEGLADHRKRLGLSENDGE